MAEIKVGRFRNIAYTLNYPMNEGRWKQYIWAGAKGEKVDIKPLPEEVVDYLLMNSQCFKTGDLKIIEDTAVAKEAVNSIAEEDLEAYKSNTHSKDDIRKLIGGNYKKLESELKKANIDEKRFFADVAVEMKLDSASKQKIIADAVGIPVDILFDEE